VVFSVMTMSTDCHFRALDLEASQEDIVAEQKVSVPVPETDDPAILLRHMESHEPLKLALVRDYPLIVHRLEKTARGIKKMMAEREDLHKGLGWLHYRACILF
jgi:U3 small nucleolar RNA-associated protein 3